MAENSKIEWCHHTFNPWIGCTKVGPGCDNCYAESDFGHRRKVVQWGAGQPRKRTAPSTWAMPAKWNSEAERLGIRYRVFCASLADVFDNEVPAEWRTDLLRLIASTQHLDWLLVTKRVGNAFPMLESAAEALGATWGPHWRNVWLGATITSQAEADRDVPKLLQTPAAVRFLSMEPLLGPVDLTDICHNRGESFEDHFSALFAPDDDVDEDGMPFPYVDWVIVGGESGPKARPMHPQWARNLRDQCAAAGVPFLFKQWGEFLPLGQHLPEHGRIHGCSAVRPGWHKLHYGGSDKQHPHYAFGKGVALHVFGNCDVCFRVGKKAAGRILDGVQHDEYPEFQGSNHAD